MERTQVTKAELADALRKALLDHTNNEMPRIRSLVQEAVDSAHKEVLRAFPDGLEAHREAHERMIAAARSEEQFWKELKTDIAKKSIWGILHILIILTLGTVAVKLGVASVIGIVK